MNLKRVMDGLTRSGIGGGFSPVPHRYAVAHSAGRGRSPRVSGAALGVSGAAVIGSLAWRAYCRYRAAAADGSVPRDWSDLVRASFLPQDVYSQEFLDFLLLRAMITAAGSDGHIDAGRRARILRRICILEMTPEEKAFLIGEIQRPMTLEQLVGYARSPDLALEIYAASVLAADAANPDARRFLETLAQRLALPEGLASAVHGEIAAGRGAADVYWRGRVPSARPLASV